MDIHQTQICNLKIRTDLGRHPSIYPGCEGTHPPIHHCMRVPKKNRIWLQPQRDTYGNPNCCISQRKTSPQCGEGLQPQPGEGTPDVLCVLEEGECLQTRREGHSEQKEEHTRAPEQPVTF